MIYINRKLNKCTLALMPFWIVAVDSITARRFRFDVHVQTNWFTVEPSLRWLREDRDWSGIVIASFSCRAVETGAPDGDSTGPDRLQRRRHAKYCVLYTRQTACLFGNSIVKLLDPVNECPGESAGRVYFLSFLSLNSTVRSHNSTYGGSRDRLQYYRS